MKPTAHQLAMRDPAAAALMGVGALGADFGEDWDDDYGAEFGDDEDDDLGAEFGAAAMQHHTPSSQQLARMWQARQVKLARAHKRVRLLDPNRGSGLKVERYVLSLEQTPALVIGVASAVSMQSTPDCSFRPQRFSMIVPTPQFVLVSQIKMANVEVLIGSGRVDAFQYNANGVGQAMDMPTLTPANRATVSGNYTGFAGGFPGQFSYALTASFIGPSSLAGGAAI